MDKKKLLVIAAGLLLARILLEFVAYDSGFHAFDLYEVVLLAAAAILLICQDKGKKAYGLSVLVLGAYNAYYGIRYLIIGSADALTVIAIILRLILWGIVLYQYLTKSNRSFSKHVFALGLLISLRTLIGQSYNGLFFAFGWDVFLSILYYGAVYLVSHRMDLE